MLVDFLCQYYNVEPKKLSHILKTENIRIRTCLLLSTFDLYKIYGNQESIDFCGLTYAPVKRVPAFGGYLKISVQQYIYAKYRRKLLYPDLPCIIVCRENGHKDYFPIELISF